MCVCVCVLVSGREGLPFLGRLTWLTCSRHGAPVHTGHTRTHLRMHTCVHANVPTASGRPLACACPPGAFCAIMRELPAMQIDPSGRRWSPFRWQECPHVDATCAGAYVCAHADVVCAHMNRHIVYSTACTYGMRASRERERERERERNFRATIETFINAGDASV